MSADFFVCEDFFAIFFNFLNCRSFDPTVNKKTRVGLIYVFYLSKAIQS